MPVKSLIVISAWLHPLAIDELCVYIFGYLFKRYSIILCAI